MAAGFWPESCVGPHWICARLYHRQEVSGVPLSGYHRVPLPARDAKFTCSALLHQVRRSARTRPRRSALYCAEKILSAAIRCRYCQADLPLPPAPVVIPQPIMPLPASPDLDSSALKPKDNSNRDLGIALVVVLAVALVAFLLVKSEDREEKTATAAPATAATLRPGGYARVLIYAICAPKPADLGRFAGLKSTDGTEYQKTLGKTHSQLTVSRLYPDGGGTPTAP